MADNAACRAPRGRWPAGLAPNVCNSPAHDILLLHVCAEVACCLQGLKLATCRHLLELQTMRDVAGRWLQQG